MFDYSSRSLKRLGTGASFVVVTNCGFKYTGYKKKKSHFTIDVLNLKLCFERDGLTERSGSLSEPGSIFSHADLNLLISGVPLLYWLEKACSAYPRLTGSTFLFNIM